MAPSLLADWANFYVITGSAAAGLTGLTFVVIALASDNQRASTAGLRTFVTPTIIHFGAVLAVAAFVSMPHLSVMKLSVGFGAAGLAGLVYVGTIVMQVKQVAKSYTPVLEDWLGHAILPALAYGSLFAAAFTIGYRPEPSLYVVAAASLLLLLSVSTIAGTLQYGTRRKGNVRRMESRTQTTRAQDLMKVRVAAGMAGDPRNPEHS
jgi:hypothetical protein